MAVGPGPGPNPADRDARETQLDGDVPGPRPPAPDGPTDDDVTASFGPQLGPAADPPASKVSEAAAAAVPCEATATENAHGNKLGSTAPSPSDLSDLGMPGMPKSDCGKTKTAHRTLEERKVVEGVQEVFDFWDYSIDILCPDNDSVESLAEAVEMDSLSTCFSGVRAPETAMAVLRYRLGQRLGREIPHKHRGMSHAIEWNAEAQKECLLAAKKEGSCVFGDVGQFFRPEIRDSVIPEILRHPAMCIEALAPLLMNNRLVHTRGHCLAHGRKCLLRTCDRHMAGTSCRPFSRRGTSLGLSDPDAVYLLAWLGLRRTLQERDISQENVEGFPGWVFDRFIADLYWAEIKALDAVDYGIAVARKRQFVRLRHKHKIVQELSPLAQFSKRFFRAVNYCWSQQLGSGSRSRVHESSGSQGPQLKSQQAQHSTDSTDSTGRCIGIGHRCMAVADHLDHCDHCVISQAP